MIIVVVAIILFESSMDKDREILLLKSNIITKKSIGLETWKLCIWKPKNLNHR